MFKVISLFALCILLIGSKASAQTGTWQSLTSTGSPTAREECSYVQAGSKFYLLGGRGSKPVQSYNPATNTWATETTSNPQELHHFQGVQYNGKIYVVCAFSGNCCHETPTANIFIFDPATKSWSTGPQIPSARRRGAAGCVVYNNKIYVVCGIVDGHSSGWVSWLDVFDPQTNTWTQLPNAPRARDHFFATVANGKIYCIGGRRSGYNGDVFQYTTAEVDVYNIATNSWSTLPSSLNIPTQRAACATALLGDEILVIGGEIKSSTTSLNKTEAFNVVTQRWRTLAPLVQGRNGTSAVVNNNKVYIASGAGNKGGSNKLNTQEMFSFGSSTPDCNGVPGGTAILDGCNICSGGNTNHVANSDKDLCGVCFGNNSTCNDCNGVPRGSAFRDDCGVCSGGNTGHVANSGKDACGVCFGNGSTCGGSCQPLQVTALTLVKVGTAGDIGTLTEGMTIYLTTIGNFNIRANICPGSTVVQSVKFVLNGTTTTTESTAPYAIGGDSPIGSYKIWNAPIGNHTLVVTPYSGTNGSGTAGISFTAHFTVVSGSAPKTDLSLANQSNQLEETLRLYPNPNSGQFMLEVNLPEQNDLSISVYNHLGQMIYSHVKLQFAGELKEQIQLSDQPSGMYFLKLAAGSKFFNEKIIVNN